MKVQHKSLTRKLELRRLLLRLVGPGAVYVPYCGDGDIANALYTDREVYPADIDPERVKVAQSRPATHNAVVADCEKEFPFRDKGPFAVADFDAWGYPYNAYRLFVEHARLAPRVALFFTDGNYQHVSKKGLQLGEYHGRDPDGNPLTVPRSRLRSTASYWTHVVEPWVKRTFAKYHVITVRFFTDGHLLYWGIVYDTPVSQGNTTGNVCLDVDVDEVLRQSREAVTRGNVKWELTPERLRVVQVMAECQCTLDEMSRALGVPRLALLRACKRVLHCTADALIKKYAAHGKASLRRWQWKAAEGGNIPMLIWLGKQYLGQSDRQQVAETERSHVVWKVVHHDDTGPATDGQEKT